MAFTGLKEFTQEPMPVQKDITEVEGRQRQQQTTKLDTKDMRQMSEATLV
jgi:hypothetical protein